LLIISNKISPLQVWHYVNKPLYICVAPTNNIWFYKISCQRCVIHWLSKY